MTLCKQQRLYFVNEQKKALLLSELGFPLTYCYSFEKQR